MKWFIIFVTLLGVQFALGISENKQIIDEGRQAVIDVEPKGVVKSCKLRTNTHEEYEYTSSSFMITNRIFTTLYPSKGTCSISISSFRPEDAGVWEITVYATNKDNVSTEEKFMFELYVIQKVKVVPINNINVYEGYYAHAKIAADLENITECKVVTPKSDVYSLTSNGKNKNNDFELFGKCGFKFRVNKTDEGTWELRAYVENSFIIYSGSVRISVKEDPEGATEMMVVKLEHGQPANLNILPQVTFCQLEDPSGNLLPVKHDSCSYRIESVTRLHEGIWMAHYGVVGKMTVMHIPFKVMTTVSKNFTTEISKKENGDIILACRMHYSTPQTFKSCRFITPNGTVLNLAPGIGTDKYTTYKVSPLEEKQTNAVCGLIIRNPGKSDYGSWKCHIGSGYNEQDGSILEVQEDTLAARIWNGMQSLTINAPDVYVKRGDSFTIKCEANKILNYCWFRSPNGTAYSVSSNPEEEHNSATVLQYTGAGLSLGDCSTTINTAVDDMDGEWTCNMGVVNDSEKSKTFRVRVTESYIMTDQKKITFIGEPVTLIFRILPSITNSSIQYCRWIHPNGHGIYNDVGQRYTTSNTKTECKLDISSNHALEDIGRWTCVAGFYDTKFKEAVATMDLEEAPIYLGTVIGLTLSALILFALTSFFVYVILRRRRRSLPADPPRYSTQAYGPEAYLPPKPFNTK